MKPTYNMRTFYTLILSQTFSLLGSRISGLAVSIWVFNQTGNATPFALVAFFSALPSVLASTLSGMLADRWDRRYVMALADGGQVVGTILLFISFSSGNFQLWHLYAVTLIQSVFGVFQGPAFQASVTLLVPDDQRDRANAIQQITGPVAGIIAPAIAGVVYSLVGISGAIMIDLFTFIVAFIVVLVVRIPRPEQSAEGRAMRESLWREMSGGLRFLMARWPLMFNVLYTSFVNFLVAGAMALALPYLLARTQSETTLGILLAVFNLSAIAGAVVMGAWGGTRPRIHTIMLGIIVAGVFLTLMGAAQSAPALGVTLFCFMFPLPFANAAFISLMQAKVPPDIQGRVFAVSSQISLVLTPLAYFIAGPLADNVFEPAVGQPGWEVVAPVVGGGAGAGMGLILFLAGGLTTIISLIVYAMPITRHLEASLPDYEPAVVAPQSSEVSESPDLAAI
jgi:MFS transporter, DHA3 family, macrolide efflux protein